MEELQLKKVYETDSDTDAIMVRAELEEANIKVVMNGLESSALGSAIDGNEVIEIFVAAEFETKAQSIVDAMQAAPDIEVPAWTCKCGEEVDAGFFVCWSCQAEYEAAE